MELRHSQRSQCSIIDIHGDLDLYNAFKLKDLTSRLTAEHVLGMVINLDDVKYIDSTGVGAVIYSYVQCKNAKISFFLTNVHGSVRRVIELTKLIGFLPIVETVDEALQKIGVGT